MVKAQTSVDKKLQDRAARKSQKRDAKRRELADSAVSALCSLGYANTSLRDIAEVSGHPLGTFSYYFEGRQELIIFCVQQHKSEFLENMRQAALTPGTLEDVIAVLSLGLANATVHDSHRHRLWFDIRNQSVFDPSLRPMIDQFEAESIAVLKVIEQRFLKDRVSPDLDTATIDYAAIDGLFRHLVQGLDANTGDVQAIKCMFQQLLNSLWASGRSSP